jgi:hypothetical protein
MVERVAVLLGTVQFRLKVKVNVPDRATLADAEQAAQARLADDPVRKWTLVDELGVGHPVQLALDDFLQVNLQSVETCVPRTRSRKSFGRRRIEHRLLQFDEDAEVGRTPWIPSSNVRFRKLSAGRKVAPIRRLPTAARVPMLQRCSSSPR